MEHLSQNQKYSWSVNLQPYREDWWEHAEDRDEYEEAVYVLNSQLDAIENTMRSELWDSEDAYAQLDNVYHPRNRMQDNIDLYFKSNKALTEEELVDTRRSFIDIFEESLADLMITGNILTSDTPGETSKWYEKGLDYEADPETASPITVSTDPDFEGSVTQLAEEKLGPEDN